MTKIKTLQAAEAARYNNLITGGGEMDQDPDQFTNLKLLSIPCKFASLLCVKSANFENDKRNTRHQPTPGMFKLNL